MKLFSEQFFETPPPDFQPIPKEDFDSTVVEYYERIVESYSDKVAIIDKYSEINYRDFNSLSNQCARSIINILGDVKDKTVLFLADLTISSIIAILGIVKSGNIYVALDSTNPIDRLKAILEDSQAQLIITSERNKEIANTLAASGLQILNLDSMDPDLSRENLPLRLNSKNLAVIFYTSGSTGKPKGVLLDHRALMERVAAKINTEMITSEDRLLLPFPVGFGWSTQPVFGALLTGATLYIRSYTDMTLSELNVWIENNQITYLPATPSFFRQFLASLPQDGHQLFPRVRNIHIGGESMHPQDVHKWQKIFSDNCKLIYSLASTEAGSITEMIYHTNSDVNQESLTVGYLFDPMKLFILDEEDMPVQGNAIGQIAYRSPAMLSGYWERPEINSQKFIPDPEDPSQIVFLSGDMGRYTTDGSLEFLGRKDNQLKIRGFRVDTAEVEAALMSYPSVKGAFVTGWSDNKANLEQQLVAYLSLKDHEEISLTGIQNFLTINLPEYMLPTRFVILPELPLNPNGKVDRKALPDPGNKRPEINSLYTPPGSEIEKNICEIWQEILNLDTVGVTDNFFELGGNSLTA
jgi:amino acid adenylation domain-containing protein